MKHSLESGSTVEVSFGYGNRMVSARAIVKDASGDRVVLDIDGDDNTMTLEPGSDIYLLRGGGLYNVVEAKQYPRITIEKVHERRHVRVNDVLTVSYRAFDTKTGSEDLSQARIILEDVFGETASIPDSETVTLKTLYQLLYQLNLKIDRLMDTIEIERGQPFRTITMEQVNISAAGIRLNLPEKTESGNLVALRLELPLETCTRLTVLGAIVSSEPADSGSVYRTTIKFIDLDEDTEEAIIRYVFKRQRELLRR